MTLLPRRRFVPRAQQLEPRRLLTNFTGTWLGQSANLDLCGPDAGVGPDGHVDDEIQLTTSNANLAIDYVQISLNGSSTPNWESFPNVDRYSNAELIDVSGSSGKTYNIFINPFGTSGPPLTGNNQTLTVNVYYHDATVQGSRSTDSLHTNLIRAHLKDCQSRRHWRPVCSACQCTPILIRVHRLGSSKQCV